MFRIKKRYVVNEQNKPVEVILDLATFEKMEEILEDHLFGKILQEAARQPPIPLEVAKRRYARMKKSPIKKRR